MSGKETSFIFISQDGQPLTLNAVMVYNGYGEWVALPTEPPADSKKTNPGIEYVSYSHLDFGDGHNCTIKLRIDPGTVQIWPAAPDGSRLIFSVDGSNNCIAIDIDGEMTTKDILGPYADSIRWSGALAPVGIPSTLICAKVSD